MTRRPLRCAHPLGSVPLAMAATLAVLCVPGCGVSSEDEPQPIEDSRAPSVDTEPAPGSTAPTSPTSSPPVPTEPTR